MTTTKNQVVKIKLHDGNEYQTTISNYDAKAIADSLSDESTRLIAIGDVVINSANVSGVFPVKE